MAPSFTTLTSREFNQDTAQAKRAAESGPVFVTTRGQRSHVLLSIGEYDRLTAQPVSLADLLADDRPEADFSWEPPRLEGSFFRVPEAG